MPRKLFQVPVLSFISAEMFVYILLLPWYKRGGRLKAKVGARGGHLIFVVLIFHLLSLIKLFINNITAACVVFLIS